jgi:hypothetical protein
MNEQVSTIDQYATQLEAFFSAHPIAKWLALAWVFGWVIALIGRIFIKMSPWSEEVERKLVFLCCIVFSGLAAYRMWDGQYPLIVATVLGGTSPFAYLGLAWLLCWKWPSLTPHLSLRKDFSAAVDDEAAAPTPKEPIP